jgi:hypothetical protein
MAWRTGEEEDVMFEDPRDIATATSASPFANAYERLSADLEQALGYDDAGHVSDAYQEYTDACAEALADPAISERVNRALERLTGSLEQALARQGARARVEDAAAGYLDDVGAAWPELEAREGEVESLVALATGMTTLAWLFGLGAAGAITPFGPRDLFGGAPARSFADEGGLRFTHGSEPNGDPAAAPAEPAGDAGDGDGIVWQEFAVGESGEIVQRAATNGGSPPRGEASSRRPREGAAPSPRRGTSRAARGRAGDRGDAAEDPLARVDRAFASYADALRSAGVPVGGAPGSSTSGATLSSDLEKRTADLAGAYLRLGAGTGSIPDLYHHYAAFLAGATQLVEEQLSVVRNYERLIAATLQGRRPGGARHDAEAHYQRFLTTVRDAWSQIDPADLTPERLTALSALTARAATLHDTALGAAGYRPSL